MPARSPTRSVLAQANRLLPALASAVAKLEVDVSVEPMRSQIGSGSLPVDRLPSAGLVVRARKKGSALNKLEARLRGLPVPVIGRIADNALWLDLRCLGRDEENELATQLASLTC